MTPATLVCPHCHQPIPLDEALNARATQVAEERLTQDRAKLESTLAKEFDQKLEQAVKSASEKARIEAGKQQSLELRDLENRLKERDRQLDVARDQELQLRKKARELEEAKASWELTKAREIDQERLKIRQAEKQQLTESLKVKEEEYRRREKELAAQNDIMQKTIEDLRRQVQQGSQQVQGEAQEKDLKSLLSTEFPTDEISDVPTGAIGADLVQKVGGRLGKPRGIIVWESKAQKKFSSDWLSKLKHDQGLVHAHLAVIVTRALPQEIDRFGQINGIWICAPEFAIPLANILRVHLEEVFKLQISQQGKDVKMAALYDYLVGPSFRNQVEQMLNAVIAMQQDLDSEMRAMRNRWKQRKVHIDQMISATAGFYGNMQGIIGGALPTIPQLELDSVESPPQIEAGGLFES